MIKCPHCNNEDKSMIEFIGKHPITQKLWCLCAVCSKTFLVEETERHSGNKND